MALRIDPQAAQRSLESAHEVALSSSPVPDAWRARADAIGQTASKTYVAALGTALLARATDATADPMSIKATADKPYAYSARTLCHGIFVPFAREHGFDLGATGREPLNNQPFFRYERIDEMDRVRDRDGLEVLLSSLSAVGLLSSPAAQDALAAFIRVRIEVASDRPKIDTRGLGLGIQQTVTAIREFTVENPEGGKRGQAVTAGVLDLLYENVRTGRVNDPSRRFPGDVQAMDGATVLLAAEVRQKAVALEDVRAFAALLHGGGIANGLMVALSPDQAPLDRDEILRRCEDDFGVMMNLIDSVDELVTDALTWSGVRIDTALERLRNAVTARLEEIELSAASLQRWEDLLRAAAA